MALWREAFSPISHDAPKRQELLDEDEANAAMKPGMRPAAVRVTPAAEVFGQ